MEKIFVLTFSSKQCAYDISEVSNSDDIKLQNTNGYRVIFYHSDRSVVESYADTLQNRRNKGWESQQQTF